MNAEEEYKRLFKEKLERFNNFVKAEQSKPKKIDGKVLKVLMDYLQRNENGNERNKENVQYSCKRKIGVFDKFAAFFEFYMKENTEGFRLIGFTDIEIYELAKCYRLFNHTYYSPTEYSKALVKIFEVKLEKL